MSGIEEAPRRWHRTWDPRHPGRGLSRPREVSCRTGCCGNQVWVRHGARSGRGDARGVRRRPGHGRRAGDARALRAGRARPSRAWRSCGSANADPARSSPTSIRRLAVTKVSSGGRTFALELPRPTRAAQDQALACAGVDRRPDRRDRRRDRADRRLPRRGGHAGRSRRQPAARLEPAGPGGAPADRPHRAHRLHRADRGRERRRQGAGGAADPPVEPAQSRTVRRRQLRRDRRDAARGRAVRHRGPHGDRRARPPRQVRAGRRRHAVPRRGRRPVAVRAGQAAARAPGVLGRAGRRTPDQEGRHPHRGRDQPQPVGAGDARDSFAATSTTG